MSILSRLNIFLQAFQFERHIEHLELQVDDLLETFSAKMKTRNRAAIGRLIDTLKFMGQLGFEVALEKMIGQGYDGASSMFR